MKGLEKKSREEKSCSYVPSIAVLRWGEQHTMVTSSTTIDEAAPILHSCLYFFLSSSFQFSSCSYPSSSPCQLLSSPIWFFLNLPETKISSLPLFILTIFSPSLFCFLLSLSSAYFRCTCWDLVLSIFICAVRSCCCVVLSSSMLFCAENDNSSTPVSSMTLQQQWEYETVRSSPCVAAIVWSRQTSLELSVSIGDVWRREGQLSIASISFVTSQQRQQ